MWHFQNWEGSRTRDPLMGRAGLPTRDPYPFREGPICADSATGTQLGVPEVSLPAKRWAGTSVCERRPAASKTKPMSAGRDIQHQLERRKDGYGLAR
jgi:hypothetical protein